MENRTLYFGDNLEILREKIPDETFDLIYLDPPFNSNRNYNVIFKEGVQESPAQVHAFEDSWHWTREAQDTFDELIGVKPSKTPTNQAISELMQALRRVVGEKGNDMLAYLTMMTIRLIELHRALKPTGSIYLHCDSTASHYLKIVIDAVFDKGNFRDEIIWRRGHINVNTAGHQFPRNHDVILFYSKSQNNYYERSFKPYSESTLKMYKYDDNDGKGKYRLQTLRTYGNTTREKMRAEGKIVTLDSGKIYFKQYLSDKGGVTVDDVWEDIPSLQGNPAESLGYPTQKPEALLDRIIKASSKEGDWILDPFCGCGTTVSVAERLKRNWVGIDVAMLAINLIRHRLEGQHSGIKISVDGIPKDMQGAQALFAKDPFQFEYWALDLVNAIPAQNKTKEKMRGADSGVDGIIYFVKDRQNGKDVFGKLIVQVKGGKVQRNDIATLKGDIERENADGGIFVTLEEATKPMQTEVVQAGMYNVQFGNRAFPKIQILTVEELLGEKKPDMPVSTTRPYYKEAEKAGSSDKTMELGV